MRLQRGSDNLNPQELQEFAEWLFYVGDGKLAKPNDGYAEIEIPDEFLITYYVELIQAIVNTTYQDLVKHYNDEKFLDSRAILASNIDIVNQISDYILSLVPGDHKDRVS